jgi:hypothetical protein
MKRNRKKRPVGKNLKAGRKSVVLTTKNRNGSNRKEWTGVSNLMIYLAFPWTIPVHIY